MRGDLQRRMEHLRKGGMSYAEIASRVGKPYNQVSNALADYGRRASRRLNREKGRCVPGGKECDRFVRLIPCLVDIADSYLGLEVPIHGENVVCAHGNEWHTS